MQAEKVTLIAQYKRKIEEELETICADILTVVEGHLIPMSKTNEAKVSDGG